MRGWVVLLLGIAILPAPGLSLDLAATLSPDPIPPGGNTTLNVSIRGSEATASLTLEVSAPTADRLQIEPAARAVGPLGPGEERYYSFQLEDRGLDPGRYRILVNATSEEGVRSKEVFLTVGGPPRTPGLEAWAALLALASALGLFKVRGRPR